jgi:succinate dehydrogenase / fumarate reductase iron-sulfur subunit
VWDCTRCYFCNERCPKGVDPRDAIAKIGAEIYSEGMLSDKGARHAQVFDVSTRATGYLLETALVPYTDPLKAMDVKFAMQMARAGKVPNPLKPHRAKKLDEVRKLHKLLKTQEKDTRAEKRAGVSVDREEAGS